MARAALSYVALLATGVKLASHTHKFVIFHVEENELGPQVCLLCSADDFWNVDTRDEEFQMLHH